MKEKVFLLVGLFSFLFSNAQFKMTLHGVILELETGESIEKVKLTCGNQMAFTHSDGSFEIALEDTFMTLQHVSFEKKKVNVYKTLEKFQFNPNKIYVFYLEKKVYNTIGEIKVYSYNNKSEIQQAISNITLDKNPETEAMKGNLNPGLIKYSISKLKPSEQENLKMAELLYSHFKHNDGKAETLVSANPFALLMLPYHFYKLQKEKEDKELFQKEQK